MAPDATTGALHTIAPREVMDRAQAWCLGKDALTLAELTGTTAADQMVTDGTLSSAENTPELRALVEAWIIHGPTAATLCVDLTDST